MSKMQASSKGTGGRSSVRQPPIPIMTTQQAYTGLQLHENWELADALETYIKGYIDCAKSNNIQYLPDTCAEHAVAFFSLHASWSTNGGGYPWNHIDSGWMNNAMQKLVSHVWDGHSLSDLGLENGAALGVEQGAGSSAANPSAEGGEEYVKDEDEDDDDDEGYQADDAGLPDPPSSGAENRTRLYRSYRPAAAFAAPYSIEPPSQRAVDTRTIAMLIAACSSSPLSSPPSSILSSDGGIGGVGDGGGDASASTSTEAISNGGSDRRQTRSVARAAHAGGTPAPAGTAGRKPDHQDGTRSQRRSRSRSRSRSHSHSSTISNNNKNGKNKATGAAVAAATAARSATKGRRRGHTVRQDAATGETYDAWSFERILDSRHRQAGEGDLVEYKVGWTYHRPTWQPAVDLADNPDDIAAFHAKSPEKPGPPGWFTRGRSE